MRQTLKLLRGRLVSCPDYKVFNSTGGVVKASSAASSEAAAQDMWHGTAATANGFAIRFNLGTERVRLFDNSGNPVTTNIDLAAVTGYPEAGAGGRGDGTGFKSNGKDAYVYAAQSASGHWVTVLNANGTVRYSRAVTDMNELGAYANGDRLDAAIAEDGRVIVAFDASNNDTNNPGPFRLTQARVFDPRGNAMGPVFYVSERENATNAIASNSAGRPPRRVARQYHRRHVGESEQPKHRREGSGPPTLYSPTVVGSDDPVGVRQRDCLLDRLWRPAAVQRFGGMGRRCWLG